MMSQRSILQFLKNKDNHEDEVKINCNACGTLILKAKIDWHRDFSCSANTSGSISKESFKDVKLPPKKTSKLSRLNRKVKSRNVKEEHAIEIINISDSDENDSQQPSPILFDIDGMDSSQSQKSTEFEGRPYYSAMCGDWRTPESSPIKSTAHVLSNPATPQHQLNNSFSSLNTSNFSKSKSMQKNDTKFPLIRRIKSSICFNDASEEFECLKLKKKYSASTDDLTKVFTLSVNQNFKIKLKRENNDSGEEFEEAPKFNFPSPIKAKSNTSSFGSCSSKSSYTVSPCFAPGLATPERTPTPSPERVCSQEKENARLSRTIASSPQRFGIRNSGHLPSSFKKRTPRSTYKALQNTSPFHNSSLSPKVLGRSSSSVKNLTQAFNVESKNGSPLKGMTQKQIKAAQAVQYRTTNGLYLDNFQFILSSVLSQPLDVELLGGEDFEFIDDFRGLSLQAKKLYIRLFQRKLKWNRVSKIEYNDICDKEDILLYINELTYAQFLFSENELSSCEEALSLLLVNEVKALCKEIKIPSTAKKENLINSLLQHTRLQKTIWSSFKKDANNNDSFLLKKIRKYAGRCCLINKTIRDTFKRILTLFSLPHYDEDLDSGQQSQLSVMLLVSLGKVKFPEVSVVRTLSPFQSRDDLIRFDKFHQLENEVRDLSENKKWKEVIDICKKARESLMELQSDPQIIEYDLKLPTFLRKFTSISLLLHILCYALEAYQHLKDYQKAVALIEELLSQDTHLLDYRGRWYDRLALNLDQHLKNPKKALQIISKGLKEPSVRVGHRLSLCQRVNRILSSKRGMALSEEFTDKFDLMEYTEAPTVSIQGRSFPSDLYGGYKRVYISSQEGFGSSQDQSELICSVEELCITHYKNEGYFEGLHCEGRIIAAIFGVLCWDVVYSEVPDAFRSAHQGAPLDLDSQEFYENRKSLFEQRFCELKSKSSEDLKEILQKVWTENEGKICIFDWNLFRDVDHLQGLVESLGMDLVCAICRRLAMDHRFTRSGFPDLVVWNPSTKKSRIVEVKGPNDKLSTKQILWLDYLLKNGAMAEVCHVEALGSRKRPLKTSSAIKPKRSDCIEENGSSTNCETKRKKARKSSSTTKRSAACNDDDDFVPTDVKLLEKKRKNSSKRNVDSKIINTRKKQK